MGRTGPMEVARRHSEALAGREEVLKEMTPSLRSAVVEIQRELVEKSAETLKYYHRLGQRCAEIRDNPDKYLTEDQRARKVNAFDLVQEAISQSREGLRKAAAFADKYTEEDVKRLVGYRNPEDNKFRLHWGHVVHLVSVDRLDQRMTFEKKATDEMWDPSTLHAQLVAHFGGTRRAGGRHFGVPRSITGQVHQMLNVSNTWLKRQQQVWNGKKHSVFTNVLNLAPDQYTPEMLAELKNTRSVMESMQAEAADNVGHLNRTIEHVSEAIGGRKATSAVSNGAAKRKPGVGRQRPADRAKAAAARATQRARSAAAR